MSTAAIRQVPVIVQSAATVGNGTPLAIPPSVRDHKFTIEGSAGVATGAIQIESAATPDYSGTWSPVGGGPITVVVSAQLEVNFSGIFSALRARISTTITGGTVTVTYVGN
jgi:hypothetical protein